MVVVALGCSLQNGPTVIEGLRGGVGYWPADSRTAVEGAIAADLDGVQLDVGLTKDHVPVLAPDPWVDPDRCTRADGTPLEAPDLLRHYPFDQLKELSCGGFPDPTYPDAVVTPEPVMGLDELIAVLHTGPNLSVHLAIQQETPQTSPASVFATAILSRWFAADLPNELSVSSPDPAVLAAFDDYARTADTDLTLVRSWPAPGASGLGDLIQNDADHAVSGLDYVSLVTEADADGLEIAGAVADPMLLRAARREGIPVWVTVGDEPLSAWIDAPVAALVAAYPGDAP